MTNRDFLNPLTGPLRLPVIILALLWAAASPEAAAQKAGALENVTAEFGLEARGFPKAPRFADQHDQAVSFSAEAEWYRDFGRGRHRVVLHPFARIDAMDGNRTHVDMREAYYLRFGDQWEWRLGMARTFWGVMESKHLVDIINQTDGVESLDGEDKLGQPMIQATRIFQRGTLDLFVLPLARERTFPGPGGRLRSPFIIDYRTGFRDPRADLAARLSLYAGAFDIGLSAFHGTSREPLFGVDEQTGTLKVLYPVISQVGWDLQAVQGSWLFKSEALYRTDFPNNHVAASAGFEYTMNGILGKPWDLGLLSEWHYDGRDAIRLGDQQLQTAFLERDVFAGLRLAFNDVSGSDVLAGLSSDVNTGERFLFVEAGRRIGDRVKVSLEARTFQDTDPDGWLHMLRDDGHAQLTIIVFP